MANTIHDSPLHERLLAVVGDRSYRKLAVDTDHNAETVRRYMQGQAPSAEFLARMCEVYDVNAHWLLTGRGAMRRSDSAVHVLREATPSELLSVVADSLERLVTRVDRLEVSVQALETRTSATKQIPERAGSVGPASAGPGSGPASGESRVLARPLADARAAGGIDDKEAEQPSTPRLDQTTGGRPLSQDVGQRARPVSDALSEPPRDAL